MTSWSELRSLFKGCSLLTLATAFLLVVPYTTGYIPFHYAIGEFPVSPALYLVFFSGLVSLHIFKSRPEFQWSHLFLLGLLLFRLVSALIFGVDAALDSSAYVFELGAALVFAVAICCLLGDRINIKSVILVCAFASMLVSVGLNIIEWSDPGLYSNVPGRSAGWLENANDSGIAIVLMLAILLSLRLPVPLSISLIGLSGVGVYFTLSRGGILVWILTAGGYIFNLVHANKRQFAVAIVCAIVAGAAVISAFNFQSETGGGDVEKRMQTVNGLELEGLEDADRMGLFSEALAAAISSPFTGYSSGSSELTFQPHNQLLAVWLDNGLLGLGLYVCALSALVYECVRSRKVYFLVCIPIVGFIPFSHNLLEKKEVLFCWILAAGLAQYERRNQVFAPVHILDEKDGAPKTQQWLEGAAR